MSDQSILDPIDRIIETIFGLVMVLTFTCALSGVESARADIREMLFAALGCSIAWGLVDAIMYVVARVTQRLQRHRLLEIAQAASPANAAFAIGEALPPVLAEALGEHGLEELRRGLLNIRQPEAKAVTVQDILSAVGIFVIAVLSVAPVMMPFVIMDDVHRAMRASNAVALAMLFFLGFRWASLVGLPRWRSGIAMAVGGALIVAVTIALGG
jgi:VIT1/CCC1 family predicted Fe2+/Mn2+ transporter